MRMTITPSASSQMSLRRRVLHEELRSIDGDRLPLEETLKAVAIPPVVYAKCPRVEHFLARYTGRANDVVSDVLQLPEAFVSELMRFGAVYSCPVVPDTAPSNAAALTDASQTELQQIRSEAVERVGRHPSFRQPRRIQQNDVLHQHDYCRVHVHPKRFPAFYRHDWHPRLILENAHCVVVNKPPGCQVPPRVDNQLECLVGWIQRLCHLDQPLKPVHRLDTGTEGLVVLAKTREFARWFQELLLGKGGAIEKRYRALVSHPPPLGEWKHYIEENHRVPGQPRISRVFSKPTPGAARATMHLHQCRCIALGREAEEKWKTTEAHEIDIELITGRTHQIRAQLSHEGYPLLGDGLYGEADASSVSELESRDAYIGLQASRLTLRHPDIEMYFAAAAAADQSITFDAGRAWWHRRESET